MQKIFFATASVLALAACGGGSTGASVDANGIAVTPVSGPELEQFFGDVAGDSASGTANAAAALEQGIDDSLFTDATIRDLTAPGSASYEGIVLLTEVDTSEITDPNSEVIDSVAFESEEDVPDFLLIGRSEMNITFGATPRVSGGANGFVGLNIETLDALDESDVDIDETASFAEIFAALPSEDVAGSLTYSGGEIIDFNPDTNDPEDEGLGFDVTGSLALTTAVTGEADRNVTIDGEGVAAVADTVTVGFMNLDLNGEGLGGVFVGLNE